MIYLRLLRLIRINLRPNWHPQNVSNGIQQILSGLGFSNGGNISSATKEGEKMVLGLLGNIMKKQGETYLTQGTVMASLSPGLSNPLTAGPTRSDASKLVSLGSMLGAIDKGGSGGGGSGQWWPIRPNGVNDTFN